MDKTALVTGSYGFVGRHLVPKLKAAGYSVTEIDPRDPYSPSTAERFVKVAHGYKFDVVVHLAANIPDVDQRLKGGHIAYQDILTDYTMVDYLAKNPPRQCVVWPTSCAVDYPDDPYAWVKLTGEKLFKTIKGVPVYMLRPYSGYGSDQALTYPFPAILKRALAKESPLMVWGTGKQIRDFIHIDDLTDAFMLAVAHTFPAYTPVEIGTGVGIQIRDLAWKMAQAVGYSPQIGTMSNKATSSDHRVARTQLAETCGFRTKITLEEGIVRAINEINEKKN